MNSTFQSRQLVWRATSTLNFTFQARELVYRYTLISNSIFHSWGLVYSYIIYVQFEFHIVMPCPRPAWLRDLERIDDRATTMLYKLTGYKMDRRVFEYMKSRDKDTSLGKGTRGTRLKSRGFQKGKDFQGLLRLYIEESQSTPWTPLATYTGEGYEG